MPVDPNALSFSLLLGDQELEGAQALGPDVEEEEEPQEEEEDVLFRVTERWRLPTLATPVLPALYCQATMRLPGLELSHRQAIPGESAGSSWGPNRSPALTSTWGRGDGGQHVCCGALGGLDSPTRPKRYSLTQRVFTEHPAPSTGPTPSLPTALPGSCLGVKA